LYKAIVLGVISPKTSSRGKQTAVAMTVLSRTGSVETRGVQVKKTLSVYEFVPDKNRHDESSGPFDQLLKAAGD